MRLLAIRHDAGMSEIVHIGPIEALPVAANDQDDLLHSSTPEFRTVMTPEGRKGIRLERIFWQALAAIAARRNTKRSAIIGDVLREATSLDLNTTSALRSYAVSQLTEELAEVRQQHELAFAIPLLQQAPVPSFAVDRDKKLLRVNGEFNHFLRILFAEMGGGDRSGLQLNLEHPVAEIFADIGRTGESRECMLNVVMGTRFRRVRTRIVAVPPHNPAALVGYIIP
jgi:predicted DNA-binding ribbon-helix-helix protein